MMAQVFKSFIFSFVLFCSSFLFTQHATGSVPPAQTSEVTSSDDVKAEFINALNTPGFLSKDNLFTLLESVIQDFRSLSYQQTQSLSLFIPGSDHLVTYTWNFGGSGNNMFSPFPTISAQVSIKMASFTQESNNKNVMTDLSKALFKNELYKKSKNSKLIKKLTESKMSSLTLFAIKVILLFKDKHPLDDAAFIKNELFRLLLRLSLSSDITLIDKGRTFTSYLPEAINELLNLISPETTAYLDHTWQIINQPVDQQLSNQDSYLPTQFHSFECIVFNDQQAAEKALLECKNPDFDGDIKKVILKQGLQITPSFEQFIKLGTGQGPLDPATFLVGEKNFSGSLDNKEIALIVPTLATTLAQISSSTPQNVVLLQGADQRWWLIKISEQLGLKATGELIILSLIKACKEAFEEQQKYFLAHPAEAEQFNQSQAALQAEQEKIDAFLSTSEGKASVARLHNNLSILEQKQFTQNNAQKIKETEKAITQINQECKKLTQEFDVVSYKVKKQKDQALRKQLEDDAAKITETLKQKKQALTELQLKKQLCSSNPSTVLAQKKKERDELIIAITKKQVAGHDCTQEIATLQALQVAINALQANPKNLIGQTQTTASNERTKIYQQEIARLEKMLKEKQKHTPNADDAVAFFTQQEGLRCYINSLIKKSKTDKEEKLSISFIENLITVNPELNVLMSAFNSATNTVKTKFQKTLTTILKRSTHFKNNLIIYHAVVKSFMPALLPVFEEILSHSFTL